MRDGGFCKLTSCDPSLAHERDHSQGKVWLAVLVSSPQDSSYFCLHGTRKSVFLYTHLLPCILILAFNRHVPPIWLYFASASPQIKSHNKP